jgi:predicted AAA+ superfamily ATPase
LTGSNASLLSQELATHLTGRHIPIEILPFNFTEILKAKRVEIVPGKLLLPDEKAKLLEHIIGYMTCGGYPEVVTKSIDPEGYLEVLFDAVLFKDVVKRHKIRFSEQIASLGSYLINNVSSQYGAKKLANMLAFKNQGTLEKYLGYLAEAYLIVPLIRHSPKIGMRLRASKKTYVVDNGFITAKAVQHSPDTGKLMENLVFTELMKKGHHPGRELFYYKTRNDREIDFVLKKGYQITELMQVCYDMRDPNVEQREIKALAEAAKELHVSSLTVLTWNEQRMVEKDGITVHIKSLWEWLLT